MQLRKEASKQSSLGRKQARYMYRQWPQAVLMQVDNTFIAKSNCVAPTFFVNGWQYFGHVFRARYDMYRVRQTTHLDFWRFSNILQPNINYMNRNWWPQLRYEYNKYENRLFPDCAPIIPSFLPVRFSNLIKVWNIGIIPAQRFNCGAVFIEREITLALNWTIE